jgi:hypothetical protein
MKNTSRNRPSVIVRGWGDEPVQLLLYSIENNMCYVGKENSKHPIGIPTTEVFAFDSSLFSTLRTAYDNGEIAILREIYTDIPLEHLACNKYQDNVLSTHGQENITDPERIEDRHR